MSSKVIKLYESILRFVGLEADTSGYISTTLGNTKEPALINGLRMVLPTEEHLRSSNPKEKMLFHPLSENILRGESEVIQKLNSAINIRLNYTIGIVAQSLLNLVDSPELHKRMTPQQLALLVAIKEVDSKTITDFISLMMAGIKQQPTKVFTNIYLNRGGSLNGQRYSRVAVVSFPFYKELEAGNKNIFGASIRAKDMEPFKQLFKFIFPNIDTDNGYSCGSNSNTAPYLDVLMRAALKVASNVNDLLVDFKDFIDDAESLMFDADWVQEFEDLDSLIPEIRRIPVQAGNEGKSKVTEAVGKAMPTVVKPELPPQETAPVPTAPAAVPVNPAVWQNPAPVQYPGVPAPQAQPQQTGIVKTNNGLDFRSMLANSPNLAPLNVPQPGTYMPGAIPQMPPGYHGMPGYPGMPPQQAPNVPRWAMPQYPQAVPQQPQIFYDASGRPMVQTPQGMVYI